MRARSTIIYSLAIIVVGEGAVFGEAPEKGLATTMLLLGVGWSEGDK